ncbi:MAG: hypothetical protein ACTSRZ_13065 [Promethearchaeota archaeon]
MVQVLQDIWIMRESLVIFKRVFNEKLDAQLFGGFMAALQTFAQELDKTGLSNFEIGNKRFYILKRDDFIFIANANKKIKEKDIIKELELVADKFFKKYPKELLENWNGDLTFFKNFEEDIQDSVEIAYKKMFESFW